MITITRAIARQLRAVFRRGGLAKPECGKVPPVLFVAAEDGLHIRAVSDRIAIEYHLARSCTAEEFALPMEALRACEGSRPEAVTLAAQPDGRIRASWFDRRVPQEILYDDCRTEIRPSFPPLPETFAENDESFLPALMAAIETCDHDSLRYALNAVQLRGPAGEMAATDSRQLLLQSGFRFPWEGDVLLPGSNVFRSPEFQHQETVQIGRSEKHVTLRIGAWTVHLPLDDKRRFPDIRGVIPNPQVSTTRLRVAPADGRFLAGALPRLPGCTGPFSVITVECNGRLAIRAKGEKQTQTTELVLSHSEVQGEPVRLKMNRCYLERALRLGFQEIHVTHPQAPLLCQDERRQFVWQLLDVSQEPPVESDTDVMRITSDETPSVSGPVAPPGAVIPSTPPRNRIEERITPVSPHVTHDESSNPSGNTHSTNGHHATPPAHGVHEDGANGADPLDPITEAEALKEVLRQALTGTNRLLAALRRQKKQAQLVRSTLASLRQLQSVG